MLNGTGDGVAVDREDEIIRKEFGVSAAQFYEILASEVSMRAVDDPEKIMAAFNGRMASLHPLDRAATDMRVGRKIKEARDRKSGDAYSPPTPTLFTFGGALLVITVWVGLWLGRTPSGSW